MNKSAIDRRGFLKAAGITGLVVGAGATGILTGCNSTGKPVSTGTEASTTASKVLHSWENSPAPIENVSETKEFDVVIVGGGMAGCATAEAAARFGASVAVIEQADTVQFRGLENGHIGSRWQKAKGLNIDPIDCARRLFAWSQQTANYDLLRTWATQSGRIFDYLEELCGGYGCSVVESRGPTAKYGWDELPDQWRVFETGACFVASDDTGGMMRSDKQQLNWNLGESLVKSAEKNGAQFFYKTRGEQLVGDAKGGIKGVIVKDDEGNYLQFNATKGVVMACGDIGGNEDMCKTWAPLALRADGNQYSTPEGNLGDGINMGLWAGAAHSKSSAAPMVHQFNQDTIMLPVSSFYQCWLTVNRDGERFAAEMPYEPYLTNARTSTPGNIAWCIFDSDYATYIKMQRPVDYEKKLDGLDEKVEKSVNDGIIFKADTLDELAKKIEVPVDSLKAAVERFNGMYESGVDVDFDVPKQFLSHVKTAPFYAIKSVCSMLVVPFGLHVDKNSQVCTIDDEPVNGLYAVGNMQGDFFAFAYPVIAPGISIGRCWTFGQLVGEALAKDTVLSKIVKL